MTTNADTLMEEPRPAKGRGPGVTAINAILNLNEHPFAFTHLKYPNYNRSIPPGLFRYPWNTTAPVNWGADPNGLMKFGTLGTMWQDSQDPGLVRYKAGGNPVNESDGEIIYTRDRNWQSFEQYLILGVKGHTVTTLKSSVAFRDLFPSVAEEVLYALNILKPKDYYAIATNVGPVNSFLNCLKEADDAGYMNGLDKRDLEALSSVSYEAFENQLKMLPEQERRELEKGKPNPGSTRIAIKVLEGLGIVIVGVASAVGAVLAGMALFGLVSGPLGWATAGVLVALLTFLVALAFVAASFIALVVWIMGFFENENAMTLLEEAPI